MIPRKELITETTLALQANPVTAILGPRQCGKTTLAGMIGQETESVYFDLEDPGDILKLTNPKMMLQNQKGLIILDEIQRKPDLFPILRVLSDQPDFKGRTCKNFINRKFVHVLIKALCSHNLSLLLTVTCTGGYLFLT